MKEQTPYCREKPLSENIDSPYRKPTQVGGVRNLRRAREPLLRNSAKWPRNFGIRGAGECEIEHMEHLPAAVKRPKRLFIKNTGLCEIEEMTYRD